jgi:hypothetical protein
MFKSNGKGVELAFNTIILIVIGLLVLFVIGFFIMRGGMTFNSGTSCEGNGGTCIPFTSTCGEDKQLAAWSCGSSQRCCVTKTI